jgi:hypothetical protein
MLSFCVREARHMKEDVLEQVVDDYLKFKGYFTTHNIAFRPRSDHPEYFGSQDSVRSDVDVVGYHPQRSGLDRVMVISCKAWQGGFDATAKLAELRREKKNPKRETWRHFRELWIPKWSEAFREKIFELTGERDLPHRRHPPAGRHGSLGEGPDDRKQSQRVLDRLPPPRRDVGDHARRAHDHARVK